MPADLKGARIGLPEYHMTAALFIGGMLSDEYGVRAEDVHWIQGGQQAPGREERMPLNLPANVDLTVERSRTLDDLLLEGRLDGLISPNAPRGFNEGTTGVRRLIEDLRTVELEYYKRTKIFPIMHTIVVRRDVYDRYPWVANSLFDGLMLAKERCYEKIVGEHGVLPVALPVLRHELEATWEIFGKDYWPYGVEANRKVLEAAVRYSYEQGVSKRHVSVEELFAPNTLDGSAD